MTVCASVSCRLLLGGLCSVGLRLLPAVGVRTARTGFSAIDIYLYTDGIACDCGTFSCLCGRAGGLWLVLLYVWIYARLVLCRMVYICIYIFIVACGLCGGVVLAVCSCIYR